MHIICLEIARFFIVLTKIHLIFYDISFQILAEFVKGLEFSHMILHATRLVL
jgi:hypothetical protein